MKYTLQILALLLFTQFDFAQERKVSGVVKDSIGEILPGVTIKIDGTYRGTQTDINGSYTINANSNEFLVFSYLGKKNKKIRAEKNEINVVLEESDDVIEAIIPPYQIHRPKKSLSETTTFKIVKGFVFIYDYSVNAYLPSVGSSIEVKGTERKTITNSEGFYEIIAKESDTLTVSSVTSNSNKEIYISNLNCYNVNITNDKIDIQEFYISKKYIRRLKRWAKIVRQRIENGYYECKD